MPTATPYAHIELRADGMPWLTGTQIKVIEVALDRIAYRWDGDEIQRNHPHLTLGQIYSSLAYYYDHQAEMDQLIEDDLQYVEQMRRQSGESALARKLRSKGLAS
jgi:uncharacterized protein (DUF433 family)